MSLPGGDTGVKSSVFDCFLLQKVLLGLTSYLLVLFMQQLTRFQLTDIAWVSAITGQATIELSEIVACICTGPPNGPVLFCWLAFVVVVVCNAAGVQAGRPPGAWERGVGTLLALGPARCWARGQSARWRPGVWAVGRPPTLHGGPVRLRPVRATLCLCNKWVNMSCILVI